ncbi:MAG: DUF4783 domain-containing protein [Bacteroidetes bacterium]|nr:DUF4783 domain-containing protein [Bacteroidota bacterium]
MIFFNPISNFFTKKHSLLVLIFLLSLSTYSANSNLWQNQIPTEIITSIKDGDSKSLANFFESSIELVVLQTTNIFSKAQAKIILNDFFTRHKPTNFKIIHTGKSADSLYAIGTLKTNDNVFRVYFLLKTKNKTQYIEQLRIEYENE